MVNEEPAAIYAKMRALLALGWCRHALARRGNGEPCPPCDPLAASWSLHGACMRATHDLNLELTFPFVRDALKDAVWTKYRLFYMWCDDHPQFTARSAQDIVESLLAECTR